MIERITSLNLDEKRSYKEHLKDPSDAIRTCVIQLNTLDKKTRATVNDLRAAHDFEHVVYPQSDLAEDKIKDMPDARRMFGISTISESPKEVINIIDCLALHAVGRSIENPSRRLSVAMHIKPIVMPISRELFLVDDPDYKFAKEYRDLTEEEQKWARSVIMDERINTRIFQAEASESLRNLKALCLPNTIDAQVNGGSYTPLLNRRNIYKHAVRYLGRLVHEELSFEPTVTTGPTTDISLPQVNMVFDTQDRTLYVVRNTYQKFTERTFLPSEIPETGTWWEDENLETAVQRGIEQGAIERVKKA